MLTNLRTVRKERGLTQTELAERLGTGAAPISLLERGLRDPRLSTVQKLAAALACDPHELYKGGGDGR